jgi:hypothetical protein
VSKAMAVPSADLTVPIVVPFKIVALELYRTVLGSYGTVRY